MTASPRDATQAALAAFAVRTPAQLTEELQRAVQRVVADTVAVALGGLAHPAAAAARRYARAARVSAGATLWGSGEVVTAETAALVNGVPLRAYDFNDLYIGPGCGGHPSDIVPGLIALAEWRGRTGAALLEAIAVGYEVTIACMDALPLKRSGWDYPNVCAIGAVCAASRLLGLTESQTREALSIAVIPHFASLEIESGELNEAGDLTMWKRFNGSDAIRQAVYATLLAEAGAEGAVRPFEGRHGFLAKVGCSEGNRAELIARLEPTRPLAAITKPAFKRWPVGSRAQSAIQAALNARKQVDDAASIREVRVYADEEVYAHLVSSRSAPWAPRSRETADHSLPYIVAAAVLDGSISVASFEPHRVLDSRIQQFLPRVNVFADRDLSKGAAAGFLSRVEIVDARGRIMVGAAEPPPGHPLRPLTELELERKFIEATTPGYGAARVRELLGTIAKLPSLENVSVLTRELVAPTRLAGAPVE